MIDLPAARRRRPYEGLLAWSLLAALAVPSRALAQTPPPASPPAATPAPAPPAAPPTKEQLAEAKKFFDAGNKLYKEGLFKEALASFLEANRIAPRESIQNNIARTYRDLKDMASAYGAYDVLLSKYGDKLKPALKTDAQHALEELAVLTGVIAFTLPDADAKVLIDGVDSGTTPLPKPVRQNIGTHQVTITKPGYEPLVQNVDIKGHDTVTIAGPMQKEILTGHVAVSVTPANAQVHVFLDGKDMGTPPWDADIEPGIHTVEARGDTLVAAPKQIDVAKKGTYTEVLETHPQVGTVAVNVDVADSDISIDGKVVAKGVFEGAEPAGVHVLLVTKPGFVDYKKDILVHDAEREVENIAMQRAQAVATAPVAPPHDWTGAYVQLKFIGLFEPTTPSNDIAQGVGYTTDTGISGSGIFGGGLDVRVGYSFGTIGIEGSIMGEFDHSQINVQVNTSTVEHPGVAPRTEDWTFLRGGGVASVGLRLQPPSELVRPTFGIGGGLAVNAMAYNRSVENVQSSSTMPGGPGLYLAPAFLMDAGILLGNTPGSRFYLGCQLVAEFSGGAQVSPSSSFNDPRFPPPSSAINVANGKDVFVGPILGFQWGE
jgi:hypothetical protein